MLKPSLIVLQPTPYCNINCSYCYLRNRGDRRRMGADVLAAVRDKIFRWLEADACPRVVWHAGEPTTVPISWYERAYAKLLPWSTAQTVFIMQNERDRSRQPLGRFLQANRNPSRPVDRWPAAVSRCAPQDLV